MVLVTLNVKVSLVRVTDLTLAKYLRVTQGLEAAEKVRKSCKKLNRSH